MGVVVGLVGVEGVQLLHLGVRGGGDIDGILAGPHHAHVDLRRGRRVDAIGQLCGSGTSAGSIGSPPTGTAKLQIPVVVPPPVAPTEVKGVGKEALRVENRTILLVDPQSLAYFR